MLRQDDNEDSVLDSSPVSTRVLLPQISVEHVHRKC